MSKPLFGFQKFTDLFQMHYDRGQSQIAGTFVGDEAP